MFVIQHNPNSVCDSPVLDARTYCLIFNGQIYDWNQIPLALNGGQSLKDPTDPDLFSVPMTIVGRYDSAASTTVLSRHLAAICPGLIAGNVFPDATNTLPSILRGAHWIKTNPNYGSGSGVNDVPGVFTRVDGVDGEADYIHFDPNNLPGASPGATVVQGRLGYLGTDYVLPFVLNTGTNNFGLNSVSILRSGKVPLSPSSKTALLAYATTILPPTGGNQSHPDLWVQPASKTAQVAIPTNLRAWPLVGTSNFIGYTCYASADVVTKLTAFLNWFETSPVVQDSSKGILTSAGVSPMPAAWTRAVIQTFLTPTPVTRPLNLNILQAGSGSNSGSGSQCFSITPGG